MRHQLARAAASTALLLAAAIGVAACGDESDSDVPPDAVARVGETTITKKQARALLPPGVKQAKLRRQTANYLIVAEWVKREAKRQGIAATTPATDAGGGKAAATLAEVSARIEALTKKAGGGPPPEEDIVRYYREHPNEYAKPEVRYMRSVAAGSRAQANAAKRALERGESWKSVIARYSTRKGPPNPPSGDMGLQPGEFDESLGSAVYAAKRGAFNGPVKTDEAWYVFELTHVDRLPRQSLDEVREHLSSRLQARRQERARPLLRRRLVDRYRQITVCNEQMRLAVCRNGPPLEIDKPWAFGL